LHHTSQQTGSWTGEALWDHCQPQALAGRMPPHATAIGRPTLRGRAQQLALGWPKAAWDLTPAKSGSGQGNHQGRAPHRGGPTPNLGSPSPRPQQHSPPFLPRLQGLLTLFAKSFASFNHSTSALSDPCWYCSLWGIYPTLQTAVPSHSTQGYDQQRPGWPRCTAGVRDSIPLLWAVPGHFLTPWPTRAQPATPQPTAWVRSTKAGRTRRCDWNLLRAEPCICCWFIRHY